MAILDYRTLRVSDRDLIEKFRAIAARAEQLLGAATIRTALIGENYPPEKASINETFDSFLRTDYGTWLMSGGGEFPMLRTFTIGFSQHSLRVQRDSSSASDQVILDGKPDRIPLATAFPLIDEIRQQFPEFALRQDLQIIVGAEAAEFYAHRDALTCPVSSDRRLLENGGLRALL